MGNKIMTKPTFEEENKLWGNNTAYVIGIDEVGRGAFAGPIVAAGVIYSQNFDHPFLQEVNDSKLLKPNGILAINICEKIFVDGRFAHKFMLKLYKQNCQFSNQ